MLHVLACAVPECVVVFECGRLTNKSGTDSGTELKARGGEEET